MSDEVAYHFEHHQQRFHNRGHATAKSAGFLKDDIVILFDGKTESMRETEVLAHNLRERPLGTNVELKGI